MTEHVQWQGPRSAQGRAENPRRHCQACSVFFGTANRATDRTVACLW